MTVRTMLISTLLVTALTGQTASAQPAVQKVTPSELLAQQHELGGKPVTVEGVLVNQGTNYFTDLQVILKDGDEKSASGVRVQPWLPTELPPRRSGSKSPATLSDYLGKRVVLEGVLTDGAGQDGRSTKVLRVNKARIVE